MNDRDARGKVEVLAGNALRRLAADLDGEVLETEGPWRSVVTLVAGGAFIAVELDWRERGAFALVGLTGPDGAPPDGYYVDSAGAKVRWHLAAVLDGSPDEQVRRAAAQLKKAQAGSGPAAMMRQLELIEAAVRVAAADLVQLLHEPTPPRSSRRGSP